MNEIFNRARCMKILIYLFIKNNYVNISLNFEYYLVFTILYL